MDLPMSTWKTERMMVNFIFKLAHSGSEPSILLNDNNNYKT